MTKLISEIGWNHMGDMTLAKEMIHASKEMEQILFSFKLGQLIDLHQDLGMKMVG